ncbi:MAG: spore germination protein [Clostridia bacterium]|nr:spore germination protein [Clostridia bacterium]
MQTNREVLAGSYRANVTRIDTALRVEESFDIIKKTMTFAGEESTLYYIDGFVKAEMMQKLMMHFVSLKQLPTGIDGFVYENVPAVEVDVTDSVDSIVTMVLSGCTAMLCSAYGGEAVIIDARTYPARETSEPENDKVMRGSRDGFVETMIFNTALIRRRIRDPRLTVRYQSVGKASRTDLAVLYMEHKVNRRMLASLMNKLSALQTDSLSMGHQSLAECLIPHGWLNPFPKYRATERPDAAAASILEGSVIVLCDNSPEALIFPTSIFDFLQETDDFYFPPLTGTYLRIVRFFVFFLSAFITPVWYLILMYPTATPTWLQFIIPEQFGKIPILVQLLLCEFAIDGLKLASLNTPNMLSNSFSAVAGLILGDFAVQVGWLSNEVIFYMAFVALASFTQSSYELGYALKFFRILMLLLTATFGLWGLIAGVAIMTLTLVLTRPLGGQRSYLYPLIPFNGRALASLFFRLKKKD